MKDRYRLLGLGNEELVVALASLVRRENDLLSDMLAHLAELDQRRLYLELGFTSMFAYCTESLGLCKSSAYRRIAAARVCRQFPEVFARVAAGELQTSVLALLSRYLTPENSAELFGACARKSCEQVEELLAARFPKPNVPDSIRRLPARPALAPPPPSSSMGNLSLNNRAQGELAGDRTLNRAQGEVAGDRTLNRTQDEVAGDRTLGIVQVDPPAVRGNRAAAQRSVEPLSDDRFGVHFTANGEFRRLLEEVRALASHRQPDGDLASLMTRALEAYRRQLLKERYGVGRKAQRTRRMSATPAELATNFATNFAKRSRHIPAEVAREVYVRDGGSCTFCAANGQRCGARRFLEIDHIEPWAEQGESTVENLRLRCRAHNKHAARVHFGEEYLGAAIAAGRAKRKDFDSPTRDATPKAGAVAP